MLLLPDDDRNEGCVTIDGPDVMDLFDHVTLLTEVSKATWKG